MRCVQCQHFDDTSTSLSVCTLHHRYTRSDWSCDRFERETCPFCDFSEVMYDGMLFCAIRDEQVHGGQTCDFWQHECGVIDGDLEV